MDLAHPDATQLLIDLLAHDAAVRFTVTGDSMRPLLEGGETVLLRQVAPGRIRCGDLLLCRQEAPGGGRLLLHRAVAIRRRPGLPALIRTQGDALWAPDEPLAGNQVLGRVSAVLRPGPDAKPLSLDTRSQRIRGLLIALRQRALWYARLARSFLSRSGRIASPGAKTR